MTIPPWPRNAPPPPPAPGLAGRLRLALRFSLMIGVLGILLPLQLALRGGERLFCGQSRPFSPYVVQAFFRASLAIMGIRISLRGRPMEAAGAVVGNHASWLDIFVLNAAQQVFFISKSEVAGWPLIGFLARAAGTLFIRREAREARAQTEALEARLSAGHPLLFFPEGTSTDGLRVLRFKATLFEAFFAPSLRERAYIQPVTLCYEAPRGRDPAFYGWFGDMEFAPHFAAVLAAPRGGCAHLSYHAPLKVDAFANRKALAEEAERLVRSGMPKERQGAA